MNKSDSGQLNVEPVDAAITITHQSKSSNLILSTKLML